MKTRNELVRPKRPAGSSENNEVELLDEIFRAVIGREIGSDQTDALFSTRVFEGPSCEIDDV